MTTSRTSCYTVARPYVGEILNAAAGEWAVAVDRARATFSPVLEAPECGAHETYGPSKRGGG
jgi:hypothetical protein